MKLADMLKDITGVKYIPLDKLSSIDKSSTVADDNTLTPVGGKALADIINNIQVTGTRRMIQTSKDSPNDEDKENKNEEKGGSKKGKKKDETSDSSDSDTSDEGELEQEIIYMKHDYIGPIIGNKGAKIQSLRAKTGAMISILDTRSLGQKKSKITIKGKKEAVQAACFEVNRIINRNMHQKPTGNSPNPKKPKN